MKTSEAITTTPILASIPPNSTNPAYGPLSKLLGTWHSPSVTPTGYNVMPVPAGNKQPKTPTMLDDWQSKNFYYYEEMTFTAPGEAPNRGQLFQQGCYGLAYEQRVYFAPNPATLSTFPGELSNMPNVPANTVGNLVHYENGLWLHTQFEAQPMDAYGSTLPLPKPAPTPPANPIVKQMSVPHGNSILALGTVTTMKGLPTHDTTEPIFPPFSLNPKIKNPALVLAAEIVKLKSKYPHMTFCTKLLSVSADAASGGSVTNIPFEVGNADVNGYEMNLWIIEVLDTKGVLVDTVLQYLQKIPMEFSITQKPTPGGEGVKETFWHITANTLSKVAYLEQPIPLNENRK